MNISPTGV